MLLVYLALLAQLPAPPVMPDLPTPCHLHACPCGCAETGECRCAVKAVAKPAVKGTDAWWHANGMATPDEFWGERTDKAGFQYTAAPAGVECRNGRCYRVAPVQQRSAQPVRYVPQAAAKVEGEWRSAGMFGRQRVWVPYSRGVSRCGPGGCR